MLDKSIGAEAQKTPGPEAKTIDLSKIDFEVMTRNFEKSLDSGLPEKYTKELFEQKCGVLFEHVLEKYPDQGASMSKAAG